MRDYRKLLHERLFAESIQFGSVVLTVDLVWLFQHAILKVRGRIVLRHWHRLGRWCTVL